MLASSSPSPTTFQPPFSSPSNNGSGVGPAFSSYHSSPRFRPSSHSPRPLSERAGRPAGPSRVPTRDAGTQYSPMSDIPKPSPAPMAQKPHQAPSAVQVPSQIAALPVSARTSPSQALAQTSSNARSPADTLAVSPETKRRQSSQMTSVSSGSSQKRSKGSQKAPKILPVKYENCQIEDMVILIADMISELIEMNDNLPLQDVVLTRFHSRTPPGISVHDYLQRLAKHATLGPAILLSMVYYIDRLCSLYTAFTITSLTVHRFLITAATVASKGLSDSFWNNSTYARVGGIKLAELGLLELDFLYRVDWRIVPNAEVLVDYYRGLVGRTDDYVLEDEEGLLEGNESGILDGLPQAGV